MTLKKETSKLLKKTTGVDGLSNEDIGNGLKEALNAGVQKGVTTLSATDGFLKSALYNILIPEDVRTITSKLKQLPGFGNVDSPHQRLSSVGSTPEPFSLVATVGFRPNCATP